MSDITKQFEELYQFLGRFNQDMDVIFDWGDKEPNFESIVRSYIATTPSDYVKQVIDELRHLLNLSLTDGALRKIIFDEFYVAYNPKYDGLTIRQWLERVLEILQEKPNPKNAMKYVGGTSPQDIGIDLDALGFPRVN